MTDPDGEMDHKTKFAAIAKEAKKQWAEVSEEDKKPFMEAFKADQERYKAEMSEYSPPAQTYDAEDYPNAPAKWTGPFKNHYLFNGDMADRGRNGIEIFMLLLAFKLACPEAVFMNRGNHEQRDLNERPFAQGGGFAWECRAKYPHDENLIELFQRYFCLMPVAATIAPLSGASARPPPPPLAA